MGLAEDSHNHCVGSINTGHFHIVRLVVGRNTLQDELACICVLSLVTFKGNIQEMKPYCGSSSQDDKNHNPWPGAYNMVEYVL
jgi:hypothetical protein